MLSVHNNATHFWQAKYSKLLLCNTPSTTAQLSLFGARAQVIKMTLHLLICSCTKIEWNHITVHKKISSVSVFFNMSMEPIRWKSCETGKFRTRHETCLYTYGMCFFYTVENFFLQVLILPKSAKFSISRESQRIGRGVDIQPVVSLLWKYSES